MRGSPTATAVALSLRRSVHRSTTFVGETYSSEWERYSEALVRAARLEDWLFVPSLDGVPAAYQVDGRLRFGSFDHVGFCADVVVDTLSRAFPDARSLMQYGSGSGRDLLAIEARRGDLVLHGLELTGAGVRVSREAAAKFGSRVAYSLHDFSEPCDRVADVGLFCYALMEAPGAAHAIRHAMAQSRMGLVLLEPIPSDYPLTYRGVLGRWMARKQGYLLSMKDTLRGYRVEKRTLATSNNAAMFPTLYVVRR